MDRDITDKLGDHAERSQKQRRWARARRPKRIAEVLSRVIAKRGYAAVQGSAELRRAWAEAVGPALAPHTTPLGVRRGVLEVLVASSPIMQEIQFQQHQLLAALRRALPEARLSAIKPRVGRID